MRHLGSFRMYESVLRQLAAAGHEVHVIASRRDEAALGRSPETLLPHAANVHWRWADDAEPYGWLEFATAVRIWLDYLRYFEPAYDAAPRLRQRAADRVPLLLRRATAWPGVRSPAGRRALAAGLRTVERALPTDPALDALVREVQPDVVLLTPLLHLGSPQVEVLRSAKAFGARTGLCVGSWDHLSSKSLIRVLPDRVFVWNGTQKDEAVTLHGVPADRVAVTGAQCYDQWFDRRPVRSRAEFCARVGLPPDRPILLWVCSALFVGSPSEAEFVRRWIEEIRASSDPQLRDASVLVRPHPARLEEWNEVDLAGIANVARYGSLPVDPDSKEDYFESLYYSSAVAGLNTSAFLEAAIVGRPVHTILLPEFQDNQEGTIHFHYLLTAGGGLLRVARDFESHRTQLAAALGEDGSTAAGRNAGFVGAFIRPHGLERDATGVFVAAVEELARASARSPERTPAWAPIARLALTPLSAAVRQAVARTDGPADRTFLELQRARRKQEHRAGREAEEQRLKTEREAARAARTRQAAAAREAEARERQAAIEAAERDKRQRKAAREREKRQHERAKRRAAFRATLRRRLGLEAKQAPR